MGVVIATTHLYRRDVSSDVLLGFLKRKDASLGMVDVTFLKRRDSGGAWQWIWSTPTCSATGGGGNAASGASTGGTASVSLSATAGGVNSDSFSWHWDYYDGDASCSLANANVQNPTVNRVFSGVANGTTSSAVSARFIPTVTDTATGASYQGSPVSTGNLSWQNTISAFSGRTDTYDTPGSYSDSVPTGAISLTVTSYGPGGYGAPGNIDDGSGDGSNGGGGGSGAKVVHTISILSSDWGASISIVVGAGGSYPSVGNASTVSGSLTNGLSISAGPGAGGDNGGTPGGGGSASGGNVTDENGNAGSGQFPGSGIDGQGEGGFGGTTGSGNTDGQPGYNQLVWS